MSLEQLIFVWFVHSNYKIYVLVVIKAPGHRNQTKDIHLKPIIPTVQRSYMFQTVPLYMTVFPLQFAKSSILWNPIIYVVMNQTVSQKLFFIAISSPN